MLTFIKVFIEKIFMNFFFTYKSDLIMTFEIPLIFSIVASLIIKSDFTKYTIKYLSKTRFYEM